MDLRANTAVDVLVGPFVDETNGKDAEGGLTIAQADVRLSKNGGNMAQKTEATSPIVHDELGYYLCKLDGTDTNAEGILVLAVHESGALPVRHEYNVLSEAAYDSLYVAKDGTAFMDVNVKTISRTDNQTTEADNLETICGSSIGTALTGLGGMSAGMKAEVESECNDALVAVNLDHLCKQATVAADMTAEVVNNSILSRVLANGNTSAFVPSTDGLQLIRDKLTDIETDTNAIDVLTKAAGAGDLAAILLDTGELQVDDIPTLIAALPTAVEIQAEMEENGASVLDTIRDLVVAAGAGDLAAIKTAVDGLNDIDAAAVNAEVVDVLRTDAIAELAGVPAKNATLQAMIQWLFLLARNKRTTTNAIDTLRNDADGGNIGASNISDAGGTFTRGKYA